MSSPPQHDPGTLPGNLPVPTDDGAAAHLRGRRIPSIPLPSSDGRTLDLGAHCARPTVLFFYPRTGIPGQPPNRGFHGEAWESIPGARGCTPQSCGFRDLHARFTDLGVQVLGISTNTTAHQQEFLARIGTPIHFLSDADLALTRALNLPTFQFPVESGGPNTLLKRMAWYVEPDAVGIPRIRKVWYPVFPPNENAAAALTWLTARRDQTIRSLTDADRPFILARCDEHFGGATIWSVDKPYDVRTLPGFVALKESRPVGMLTFHPHPGMLEVIALAALPGHTGVGTALMDAAEDETRRRALPTLMLTTTNDNLDALRFYQRRGMHIHAVHAGFIDRYRERNPAIPRIGHFGIPIRDDIELRLAVQP